MWLFPHLPARAMMPVTMIDACHNDACRDLKGLFCTYIKDSLQFVEPKKRWWLVKGERPKWLTVYMDATQKTMSDRSFYLESTNINLQNQTFNMAPIPFPWHQGVPDIWPDETAQAIPPLKDTFLSLTGLRRMWPSAWLEVSCPRTLTSSRPETETKATSHRWTSDWGSLTCGREQRTTRKTKRGKWSDLI